MEENEAALTTPLIRPKIVDATILFAERDGDGDRRGLHIAQEAADKLYTDLSTGIVRGNTVFPIDVYVTSSDGTHERRLMFINMINVENIMFEFEEEE